MKFFKQTATAVLTTALMGAGVVSANAMSSAPTGDIDDLTPYLVIGGVAVVIIGAMTIIAALRKKK